MINSLFVCLKLVYVPVPSYRRSVYTTVGSDIHMATFTNAKHTELVCTDQRRLEGNSEQGAQSIIISTVREIYFCDHCNSLVLLLMLAEPKAVVEHDTGGPRPQDQTSPEG